MPQALFGTANARELPPLKNGPPNGPFAFLVSATRHGVTGTKRRPKFSATVVVWVKLPEFPTTVTAAGLVGALAAKVNTLVMVLLLGLKFAVTPGGTPDAEKLTTPLN